MSHHNLDHKNHIPSNNNSTNKNQPNAIQSYHTILATDIPLTYSETDLYTIFSQHGSVNKIQKLSNLSCCLIEFSDNKSAANLLQMFKYKPFYIGAHKIKLEYSAQSINIIDNKTADNSTNILSINISNVKYPMTVDIIKQICIKFGKLQRIFIGKKNSENIVECLIEFDKISEAKAAKESLHGEDIYSGCCSLDVKYSKMSIVPVFKNDEESWDFTKSQIKQGILKSPPLNGSSITAPSSSANNINIYQNTPQVYPIYNYPPPLYTQLSNPMPVNTIHPFPCRQPFDPNLMYNYSNLQKNNKSKPKLEISKDAFVVESGAVFMVYNLPFNICVDHLFNIFCLYGNVCKIRFLPNQPGSAMVQMGSKNSADICIQHYNGKIIFGQEMKLVKCSKQEIFKPKNLEYLPNGTPSFKDFSNDSNNRFLNEHGISSNKILEPNRTLHFFNAPYTFAETDLSNMIIQSGVPRPLNVIIFNNKSDQIKKCIGLFEFHRLEDALVALSVLNHKPIIIPDTNQVFHMKLTFSAREAKNAVQNVNEHKRSSGGKESDEIIEHNSKKFKEETEVKVEAGSNDIEKSTMCESDIRNEDDVTYKDGSSYDQHVAISQYPSEKNSYTEHQLDIAPLADNNTKNDSSVSPELDRYASASTPPLNDSNMSQSTLGSG